MALHDLGNVKGATGATGAQGPKGDAATVTVGTTTTGAAGTNASVTNSGTSSAANLNFTIPRGADAPEMGDMLYAAAPVQLQSSVVTDACDLTLSAGTYVVTAEGCFFGANANGTRQVQIHTPNYDSQKTEVDGNANGDTFIEHTSIIVMPTAGRIVMRMMQSTGGVMGCEAHFRSVKISNKT
jgi:hypothetical protein